MPYGKTGLHYCFTELHLKAWTPHVYEQQPPIARLQKQKACSQSLQWKREHDSDSTICLGQSLCRNALCKVLKPCCSGILQQKSSKARPPSSPTTQPLVRRLLFPREDPLHEGVSPTQQGRNKAQRTEHQDASGAESKLALALLSQQAIYMLMRTRLSIIPNNHDTSSAVSRLSCTTSPRFITDLQGEESTESQQLGPGWSMLLLHMQHRDKVPTPCF